jgi:hypothetical protein
MKMIKITDQLPQFGKRVLFRGVVSWRNVNNVYFFDDTLTIEIEQLEYGQDAYLLESNTDYLVSSHPDISDLCDEYITHWCELPEIQE